jgi:hypothetical protein
MAAYCFFPMAGRFRSRHWKQPRFGWRVPVGNATRKGRNTTRQSRGVSAFDGAGANLLSRCSDSFGMRDE